MSEQQNKLMRLYGIVEQFCDDCRPNLAMEGLLDEIEHELRGGTPEVVISLRPEHGKQVVAECMFFPGINAVKEQAPALYKTISALMDITHVAVSDNGGAK